MTGLRKALGDRDGGERYIANVAGQGYCLVAPVTREAPSSRPTGCRNTPCGTARQRLVLPTVLADEWSAATKRCARSPADLIAERFVTIIGPGGMGKMTVAVCVANAMLEEFGWRGVLRRHRLYYRPEARRHYHRLDARAHDPDRRRGAGAFYAVRADAAHPVGTGQLRARNRRGRTLAERIYQEAPEFTSWQRSREAMRVEGRARVLAVAAREPACDTRRAYALPTR